MAKAFHIYFWKKEPFFRLALLFIAGILLQFYFNFTWETILISAIFLVLLYVGFSFLPESQKFRYPHFQGLIISIFLGITAMFLTWNKDARHHTNWYGNYINDSSFLIVTINEPLVEKARSYKAVTSVESVIKDDSSESFSGKLLIYLAKDSLSETLKYGDRILLKNKLQPIKNSGNPAAFNYAQYLAFQQIYYQCYLKQQDWILLKGSHANPVRQILYATRDFVVATLNKYINGNNESALAKALLIGYRVDIDKDLVQAYSNAGVVHLIAISGLHLALIYGLLLWIALRIPFLKKKKMARLVFILFCLWFFAFLTGAPASVLRAAVMFSFISMGTLFNKIASIYNSLCISAFVLLCFDPFVLWDVGFQLSYLAVLGIVILYKYIYGWFYFRNKILNYGWSLAAVSIAAQVFTLPLCFYYFHQLPLLFLIANLIAIPLSTVALWGCVALVFVSPIPLIALYVGKLVTLFLWLMNHSVLFINELSFALWDDVSITAANTLLLYFIFIAFIYWLIKKNTMAFKIGLVGALLFTSTISYKKWELYQQKRMIVYNISSHQAIDFISKDHYFFVGDKNSLNEDQLINFHLKPARVSFMANNVRNDSPVFKAPGIYQFYGRRIIVIDSLLSFAPLTNRINADYVIISKNPKIKIANINQAFDCKMIIFDGSNPLWKIVQWKKECKDLHLRFHSVSEQGAFVTDL